MQVFSRCFNPQFQNQCPLILFPSLFHKYLNAKVRINRRLNIPNADYQTSSTGLTLRIYPLQVKLSQTFKTLPHRQREITHFPPPSGSIFRKSISPSSRKQTLRKMKPKIDKVNIKISTSLDQDLHSSMVQQKYSRLKHKILYFDIEIKRIDLFESFLFKKKLFMKNHIVKLK